MHKITFALVVLSLFTSNEKAAEVEGDLLEQARSRGRIWFWWQLKFVCIALFLHALRQETGKLLLLSYAIYELGLKLNWWALMPLTFWVGRNQMISLSPVLVRDVIMLPCAFAVGMLVMRLSPRQGGQLVFLAAGMLLGRVAILDGFADVWRLFLVAVLPALGGALLMKWMDLRAAFKRPTDTASVKPSRP